MRIPRITPKASLLVSSLVLILLVSLWIGQNTSLLLPTVASKEAKLIDDLFYYMLVIGCMIFFAVQGALVYSAFVYRRKPGDTSDGPPIHGNVPLEIMWTVIPAVLALWLSVYSFEVYQEIGATAPMEAGHKHLPTKTDQAYAAEPTNTVPADQDNKALPPVVIRAEAQQYAWIFSYPQQKLEGIAELHIPIDREVIIEMQSKDVIHGFWVPQFRLKQDVIPGRTTQVKFVANKLGEYPLNCTQLCGAYHGAMMAAVFVETPEQHRTWLKSQQQASSPTLDRTARRKDALIASRLPQSEAKLLKSSQTDVLVDYLRTSREQ